MKGEILEMVNMSTGEVGGFGVHIIEKGKKGKFLLNNGKDYFKTYEQAKVAMSKFLKSREQDQSSNPDS